MGHQTLSAIGLMLTIVTSTAPARENLCEKLARHAKLVEAAKRSRNDASGRQLCLGKLRCEKGMVTGEHFWGNSDNSEEIRDELLEYSNYTGYISKARFPGSVGTLVQIARHVGTANCIRDTYLLRKGGRYRLIQTDSLAQLSAEAGNCLGAKAELQHVGAPLIVLRAYGVITAYRFDSEFEIKPVCILRYRPNGGAR